MMRFSIFPPLPGLPSREHAWRWLLPVFLLLLFLFALLWLPWQAQRMESTERLPLNELTEREREIAELAARGHSNREIATQLYL